MAKKRTTKPSKSDKLNAVVPVEDYEHSGAKRTNNPPAGLAHLDREETPTKTLTYDPHLDPQMVWAGKAERASVNVPAPSVHVHEELSAQKIVGSVRRQRAQQPLFDVGELDPAKAVEFYRHDMNWSNRMILGDSLVVMSSLLERERLAGQVQCVFIDPPYGVKYNSNFQPRIGDRSVADKKDSDLTREPEMIQAYRDTWELGVHSYLTHLRDRFTVARELLSTTGSVFVQISDENVHLVRLVLDEVFGYENYVAQIAFTKTTGLSASRKLPGRFDYLIWYARDAEHARINPVFEKQDELDGNFDVVERSDGSRRRMTRDERDGRAKLPEGSRLCMYDQLNAMGPGSFYEVHLNGEVFKPATGWWGVPEESMKSLIEMGRVVKQGRTLRFVRYLDDFPYREVTNLWTGFGGVKDKRYVVQTNEDIVERCLHLCSMPGDLVVDPTCGSGTTALVAEKIGRRWITIDTSRVAIAIARERLLTETYPFYRLRDDIRGVDSGFEYEVVGRLRRARIARGEGPEEVTLLNEPKVEKKKVRVTGPFTVEALSRYALNLSDESPAAGPAVEDAADHVEILLDALRTQGIPRPGGRPTKIESLVALTGAGSLQAEGVLDRDGKKVRFAVSLGPRFGAITMAQVSDALQDAIGFGLVVFAGFAVVSDAQAQLATGKVGGVDVALLLANPDLLAGDLLKNTSSSQTFRLYASPDVRIARDGGGWRATVEGVDSFDASTGDVTSYGRSGVQAWFIDDAYDGRVFRVSQAFFPVTNGWEKLSKALNGTVDAELVKELHSWTSLPFDTPETGRIAVRVVTDDGNASEVILSVNATTGRK
jgi:adenine-specific DNA-methyltransferase